MYNNGTRESIQGTHAYRYSIKSHHKDCYLPTWEKYDDVVDPEHGDDDFDEVSQEVD